MATKELLLQFQAMLKKIIKSPWAGAVGALLSVFWEAACLIGPPVGIGPTERTHYMLWGLVAFGICFGQAFLTMHQEVTSLRQKLQEAEETKPNIVLREPNAIHVEDVGLGLRVSGVPHTKKTVPFVKVRLFNKPKGNYPNSVAQKVSARVRISDLSGHCQVDMAGRWDDTTQPSFRAFEVSKTDLQFVDFGIEQEHGLDVAFRDTDGTFVAWNNDNYNYQNMCKPEHILKGNEFQVEIKLAAVWVNETFTFRFGSGGGTHGIVITA